MQPDRRAVVFDMDDTLYPTRRLLMSGFAAVAGHLEDWHGIRADAAFRFLARASRGPLRGRELQACVTRFKLPAGVLPMLIRVLDRHEPRIRLPRNSRRLLVTLREQGWRLGVLTNGPRARQAQRVRLLGLTALVDAVVFAGDHGSGLGKPDPQPFIQMARRLDVPPSRTVVVGDDEVCDVQGAIAAGMQPVRCDVWSRLAGGSRADLPTEAPLTLRSFADLPLVPAAAPDERLTRHVA